MTTLLQTTPPTAPPTSPDLRIVEQVSYENENPWKDWIPLPSIDFGINIKGGIKLTDTLSGHFYGLDSRDGFMFVRGGKGIFSSGTDVRRFRNVLA